MPPQATDMLLFSLKANGFGTKSIEENALKLHASGDKFPGCFDFHPSKPKTGLPGAPVALIPALPGRARRSTGQVLNISGNWDTAHRGDAESGENPKSLQREEAEEGRPDIGHETQPPCREFMDAAIDKPFRKEYGFRA
jgi:hypothetical protein